MKGKEDKSQEWITDCETTLKYNLDQFQLARLVDTFHLVPFNLETGRVIRFYEDLEDGFLLYYGSSKFKRDEVEKFFSIRNLEDEVIKLKNQRENILFLRRERIRLDLYPSSYLDQKLVKIEKDIERLKPEFIFKRTGPSWTINFNGKELIGLKGKGFEDIHFLVKNQGKDFHINEHIKETEGVGSEWVSNASEIMPERDNSDKATKFNTDHRDLINGKSIKELKEEYRDLEKEVEQADEDNDPPRKEKAQTALDNFKKFYSEYFMPNGRVRKIIDPTTQAKNRVAKRISRALIEIKNHNEEAWKHFHNALNPIDSYYLSYSPEHHIHWITE